jgi:Leu/Phe-tRNA-protein transferase
MQRVPRGARGRGAMEAQAARAATCTTSTDYSSAADTTAAMEYDEGTAASDSLVGEMTGESAAGQQSAGGRSKVAAAGARAAAAGKTGCSPETTEVPVPTVAAVAFEPGQRVELTGLRSAPERNGTFGTVVDWNEERQRYEVHLEADGARLRVKPSNVVSAPPAEHMAGRSLPLDKDQPFGKQWARQGSKDDVARLIQSHDPSFRGGRPLIRSGEHLRTLMAEGLEKTLRTDFCWSLNFTPVFLAQLVFEGFLPICSDLSDDEGLYVLLPKWHRTRCCMKFDELHVSKSARKRAKKFRLTADKCFDEVIDRCVEQHGENWLYPPMRAAFRALHHWGQARDAKRFSATAVVDPDVADESTPELMAATARLEPLPAAFPALLEEVRFHSFEVWAADGTLAAGEFGAVVGGVYTSFTGFFDPKFPGAGVHRLDRPVILAVTMASLLHFGPSMLTLARCTWTCLHAFIFRSVVLLAGTVQLCAMAKLLEEAGFAFWYQTDH